MADKNLLHPSEEAAASESNPLVAYMTQGLKTDLDSEESSSELDDDRKPSAISSYKTTLCGS
jgi:hypothetical protein